MSKRANNMETRPSRPMIATCGSSNECDTDQPNNQPTDTASYRGALLHLKSHKKKHKLQPYECQNAYTT